MRFELKTGVGLGLTVREIVEVSPHAPEILYVITNVPAIVGSNIPPEVIPVPLHVPPGVTPVKVTLGAVAHIGGTAVIVAFA